MEPPLFLLQHDDPSSQLNLSNHTPLRMPDCNLPRGPPTRKSLGMLGSNPKPRGSALHGRLQTRGGKAPRGGWCGPQRRVFMIQLNGSSSAHTLVPPLRGPSPSHSLQGLQRGCTSAPLTYSIGHLLRPRARWLTIHLCLAEEDIKRTSALGQGEGDRRGENSPIYPSALPPSKCSST